MTDLLARLFALVFHHKIIDAIFSRSIGFHSDPFFSFILEFPQEILSLKLYFWEAYESFVYFGWFSSMEIILRGFWMEILLGAKRRNVETYFMVFWKFFNLS